MRILSKDMENESFLYIKISIFENYIIINIYIFLFFLNLLLALVHLHSLSYDTMKQLGYFRHDNMVAFRNSQKLFEGDKMIQLINYHILRNSYLMSHTSLFLVHRLHDHLYHILFDVFFQGYILMEIFTSIF